MIHGYVEASGESPELARCEVVSAAEALGGSSGPGAPAFSRLTDVVLEGPATLARLAERLSLAHRCLLLLGPESDARKILAGTGLRGSSAAVRRIGSPSGPPDSAVLHAGRAVVEAGGKIELALPSRRFWLARDGRETDWLFEEVGHVDRAAIQGRRMPKLPFQRPVGLPPSLGRAAANLARVRPGDRILDPFLGTGALAAEAGLLGARVYGIDRDPSMVRGALRNLAHLGVSPDALLAGDAGEVDFEDLSLRFEALITDPPYGRSSTTGGEPADRLVARVVPRWAERVRPGGRVVVILPVGAPALPTVGTLVASVQVRVHRSLTREFRVYEVRT